VRTYESLCRQTNKDFEWLIIDDGSSDNTRELVDGYISEAIISIRYIYKTNGGKHTAINLGVKEAKGELFFILDSDDYLTNDAVEWIATAYKKIRYDRNSVGLSGIRIRPDGIRISSSFHKAQYDCTALEIRNKYHVIGDLAEIYKTDVLKEFPFPEFSDERFSPEALVWNRIARAGYKLHYVNKAIYICEYLDDGLSATITRCRIKSPKAMSLYYSEYFKCHIPLLEKIKAMINYWRFSPYYKHMSFVEKISKIGWIGSLLFYPIAMLMYLNDKKSSDV
jgi:glycosyltransferase involved in cell wall biosynthesis